ncbi:lysophospholipid acyltransferase family protein [Thorsellia anophelis]|uniref:1-acyl-sn-glycerol-3-phosphate acyltransferases n=1 Tax=Thorsellia anophelis DSM 18579 TaxID=1123402 RepID=A0A1H9Z808_9GAMM|nr:lysophospholipid acyltransferase family protein [Thorsellia anophelis]SES77468.1 1-acyl-sn-glycerol-3-phosphate acyltransferases [Thorsellia anophelis DSM 18579]
MEYTRKELSSTECTSKMTVDETEIQSSSQDELELSSIPNPIENSTPIETDIQAELTRKFNQKRTPKSKKAKWIERGLIFTSRIFTGMHVNGLENVPSGPVIFYANHQSHLDGLAVWSSLPADRRQQVHPIAAKSYWQSSKIKRYIANEVFNALLIDREKEGRVVDPVSQMSALLEDGESLILFPEGTRGDGHEIHPFKSGLFHLAQKMPSIPLVPVYLHNLHRVLPKGSKLIVPILCQTTFGQAIEPISPTEDKFTFLARARFALEALKHDI